MAGAKRSYSTRADAVRQRRSRHKRGNGLHCFHLYLPLSRIEQAVRARENIAGPVSKDQMTKTLVTAIVDYWAPPWIRLKRNPSRHT